MASATALTDWLVSVDTESKLNTSLLKQIETFLAAHFYSHEDQRYQAKSTGRANAQFQGQTAMVLASTQYGQTAMLLDVTNQLAKRSKEAETGVRGVAKMHWLGNDTDSTRPVPLV